MGLKSPILAGLTFAGFTVLLLSCREGPYAIPTPTPSFTKTFPVIVEDLPSAQPVDSSTGGDSAAAQAVLNSSCRACHAENGGGLASALKNLGEKLNLDSFTQVVRKGKGLMPPFTVDKISDKDVAGLWAYVSGAAPAAVGEKPTVAAATPAAKPAIQTTTAAPRPTTPAAAPKPATTTPAPSGGAVAGAGAGQKVFSQQCDACHPGGGKGLGPDVKGLGARMTVEQFNKITREGKPPMPGYGADKIGASDLDALWSYLKDLK